MNKKHVLLGATGIIAISFSALTIISNNFANLGFNTLNAVSDHHIEIDVNTTIALESEEQTENRTTRYYKIPRGEGDNDDIKFSITTIPANLWYALNDYSAFFFTQNHIVPGKFFIINIGFNNFTHIRFDYYISVNDDDNGCSMTWKLFDQSYHRFKEDSYYAGKDAGNYEWTRPVDFDADKKPCSAEVRFGSFTGDPTFRINKITADWTC